MGWVIAVAVIACAAIVCGLICWRMWKTWERS